MDLVDAQILRKLSWNPNDPNDRVRGLLSAWDMARELQVHGTTVKRRLEEMENAGVLLGVHMWPALSYFGIRNTLYRFGFPDTQTKEAAVSAMDHDLESCTDVHSFVGNEAWFGLSAPADGDLDAVAADFAKRLGATHHEAMEERVWDHEAPTDLEMRVLAAFRYNAFRSVSEAAEDVGVTPNTVRKRLDSLREKRVFVLYPLFYPARMSGLIPVMLRAKADDEEATLRMLNQFPDAILRSLTGSSNPRVLLALQSVPDIAAAVRTAEGIPGLSEVRPLLLEHSRPCQPGATPVRISQFVEESAVVA